MARTLAQLKAECGRNGLNVIQTGREAKGPYESALRNFYWQREFGSEPMPPQLHPMLARNIKDVPEAEAAAMWESSNWLAQEKVDGCRLLMFIGPKGSSFTSRRISDRTYRYSENTDQLFHLNHITDPDLVGTVLDGEVICSRCDVNTGAVVTKNGLQATVALLAIDPIESERIQREQDAYLVFKVFDILQDRGRDVTGERYDMRLTRLMRAINVIQTRFPGVKIEQVPTYAFDKKKFYEKVVHKGGEGIMLKDVNAPYTASSSRTKAMYKVKRFEEFDLFVTGFVPGDPDKGWDRLIGGLECSAYDMSQHPNFTGFPPTHITAVPINLTLEQRIAATACKCHGRGVKAETANVDGKRTVLSVKCIVDLRDLTPADIQLSNHMLNRVYVIRGQEFTARVLRLKHAVIMSERFDKAPEDCTIDVAAIAAKFDAKGEETGVRL